MKILQLKYGMTFHIICKNTLKLHSDLFYSLLFQLYSIQIIGFETYKSPCFSKSKFFDLVSSTYVHTETYHHNSSLSAKNWNFQAHSGLMTICNKNTCINFYFNLKVDFHEP